MSSSLGDVTIAHESLHSLANPLFAASVSRPPKLHRFTPSVVSGVRPLSKHLTPPQTQFSSPRTPGCHLRLAYLVVVVDSAQLWSGIREAPPARPTKRIERSRRFHPPHPTPPVEIAWLWALAVKGTPPTRPSPSGRRRSGPTTTPTAYRPPAGIFKPESPFVYEQRA